MQARTAGLDGQEQGETAARVLVDGVGEDLFHRTLLHNLASVHDGDGVGDLGNGAGSWLTNTMAKPS